MRKDVILLGTHFMFKEELGSRLRGVGHVVFPYEGINELRNHLINENLNVKLVIIDLQEKSSGGMEAISLVKGMNIPVLAIGDHVKVKDMESARNLGVDNVIRNSQASKSIENYVDQLIRN